MKDLQAFHKQAGEVLGEEFWQDIGALIPSLGPRVDIYYTQTTVVVMAEIPELKSKGQIGISLEGQTLILEGDIPCMYPVTENRITQAERFFGSFRRALLMPKPVSKDHIRANYSQGLLMIELQIETYEQPKNIPIEFA
ncbi:Hsp20/alpha crystallin family protein [Cohnella terricola]|nr:Hsp20/alpha crystallin family protein [Cohnella terricola]